MACSKTLKFQTYLELDDGDILFILFLFYMRHAPQNGDVSHSLLLTNALWCLGTTQVYFSI